MATCYYTQKTDGSTVDEFCAVFLGPLGKKFMQSKGKDILLLEDTKWILDLGIFNGHHWETEPCEQGKGQAVADISAVNAFKVKMNIFYVHLERKKCCTFPPYSHC